MSNVCSRISTIVIFGFKGCEVSSIAEDVFACWRSPITKMITLKEIMGSDSAVPQFHFALDPFDVTKIVWTLDLYIDLKCEFIYDKSNSAYFFVSPISTNRGL